MVLIMSGTSSQSWTMVISIPKTTICLSVAVSLLFISSSLSISHLIRLAPSLSRLGHFLIPAVCIQVLPFSVKSHSSYLCLYPLYCTLPPSIYLPRLPLALRLNPHIVSSPCSTPIQSIQPDANSFPPLFFIFRMIWIPTCVYLSFTYGGGCIYPL